MARSRTFLLLLLALCQTSATENCKDKTCQSSDELSVLIQNQMSVEKHDHAAKKMEDAEEKLSVKTSMKSSEIQEVADQAVHEALAKQLPDWLKKVKTEVQDQVGKMVPELTASLEKTYADVKDNAVKFSTDVSTCVTVLKESPAFKTKKLEPIKTAVQESFVCFKNSVSSLTKAVKASAEETSSSFAAVLPEKSSETVKVAEDAVINAAKALDAASVQAVADASEAVNSTSTLCAQVSKAIEEIETSAVSFISSLGVLNANDEKAEFADYKEKVNSFIDKLPEALKTKMQELMAMAQEAADSILDNVPKSVTEYKDGAVSMLKGSVCEAEELPAESGASDLRFGLTAALCVSMFLTTFKM